MAMSEDRRQDLIVAGVGGQGILTISGVICSAALKQGLHVKQSEVHGMAQRGGAVVSHLRFGVKPIASDIIPAGSADGILSMEPMEALRYLPYARPDAWLVVNRVPVRNIAAYPDLDAVLARIREWPRCALIDGEELARRAGSVRAVNIVLLGAASGRLRLPAAALREEVANWFSAKGPSVVERNLAAFDLGRSAAGM